MPMQFRPKRSAHQALAAFWQQMTAMGGGWVVEVDIRKFFDTLDHARLRELLQRRVRDGVLLRLIGKWLNAGVLEGDVHTVPEEGTPQGGVISPLLANAYHLHLRPGDDTVRALGVNANREVQAIETINVSLYPDSPAGMTPSAVALSPEGDTLYVVCSDANATAVSNPKQFTVPTMSLSIVLGTPTTGTPRSLKRWAMPSVPSPPITTRASSPILRNISMTRSE